MAKFVSVASEKFRTTFFIFYAISSLIPILVVMFIMLEHVKPVLSPAQLQEVITPVTYGLAAMLGIPFLGYFLMSWWINSLEKMTETMRAKTAEILPEAAEVGERNELTIMHRQFDGLYNELQNKMKEVDEYSQQLVESKKKLSKLAVTDELTTLFNRRYFDRRLMEEAKKARSKKAPLSLIMVDIDGFRKYNLTHGHRAGDGLLRNIGLLIRDYVQKTGVPFRYGGDEFAIVLPNHDVEQAAAMAEKLTGAAAHLSIKGMKKGVPETASVTCAVVCYRENLENLITEADRCLNQIQSSAKGKVVLLTPKQRQEAPAG